MPVSPADFEFYSRMTGRPIPADPAARMRMAPEVYAMRRSPLSRVAGLAGGLAKNVGKAALFGGLAALGGLAGGAMGGAFGGTVGGTVGGAMGSSMNETGAPEPPDDEPMGPVVDVSVAKGPSTRAKAENFVHNFKKGPDAPIGEAERSAKAAGYGSVDQARSVLQQKYAPRVSHQTIVPQADPNIANESFDAQRASLSAPTDPIKGGMPAQTAPGLESLVAQAGEFFEGTGVGVSPFQARGAMNELSGQSRVVKATVGDLPKNIRGDVARFISNLGSAPSESAVSAAVQAPSSFGGDAFKDQTRRMSERDQIQYKGVKKDGPIEKRIAGGVHDTPYSGSENVLGDVPLGGMAASKSMMGEMLQRGNVLPNAGAIMSGIGSAPAPGPVDPLTGDYRAFVSDKGRQVGQVVAKAQERKLVNNAKRDARAAELDDTLAKGAAHLSPEQRIQQRNQILEKEGY